MVNVAAVRENLSLATQSTRVAMRCLNGGRDSHESSLRALALLTDILDLLYRIKDEISWAEEKWFVATARLRALAELLALFGSTMKSVELYFQPGGVGVFYFRKNLLEKTYLPRLEQYKIMFLLSMQPDSENIVKLKLLIWNCGLTSDIFAAHSPVDFQLEEEAFSLSSGLASAHFIKLADLCNRRQQGSCAWIFENVHFKQWLLGYFRTLYCIGPPIIDYIQRTFTSPDVATVFVFCQEESGKDRTSTDLLKNILAQLVYRKREFSHATSSLYHSESITKSCASPKAYHNAIRAEINRFSKVLLVIDGLDMFSDKERVLGRLQKLPQQTQLLVTLREMSGVKPLDNSRFVSVLAPPEDIGIYVLSRTQTDKGFKSILGEESTDEELEDVIVNTVIDKSHGIFLLAKLQIDLLSQYTDRSLLERALMHLPESLGEAYGEAMKHVVSQNASATRYIYWVLYTFRPLTVSELKSAVDEDGTPENPESVTFEQLLQTKCAGLLSVDAVSGAIRFVHRTAKEYLDGSAARVFFPGAQKDIAEACLTAISLDEVVDECYKKTDNSCRIAKKGFLNYAAEYWGLHAREIDEYEQTVQVLIKTFLNKLLWRRPPLDYAMNLKSGMPAELGLGKYPNDWSGLHVLSFFGVRGKSKRLLEQGANINAQDNALGVSPLHCAAYQGNDEMTQFLLDNGANANATNVQGRTALHFATQNGHRKCMKLLFSHAELETADQSGATALHVAVGTATDESTVPLLVKHKVDVNFQNPSTGNTALHLAVEWKRPRIILFLIEKGASIDIPNDDGITPLQLAASMDNCEAISLLLQRCAKVEARSLTGPTALQFAAWKRHWVAFDLLIIGGADINVWNKQGETLLHEQARYSFSIALASKLLEQGANIEARTSQGHTPLQYAAMSGNKVMFYYLLNRGAKIDVETAKGETLLHMTPPVNQECIDILKTGLDEGLNVSARSSQGWTPLHETVYTGTGAINLESDRTADYIRLLIKHGASINECSASGSAETPLHLATMSPVPRPSLVKFLIEQGANINSVTREGKTALHLAAERGREPIFRQLLEAGADLNVKIPFDDASVANGEKATSTITAFDLAKKNPLGLLWFDDEGQLLPKPQKGGRDSTATIFEDVESDVGESETGESTLVGSEQQYIAV
ncbi:hypothetical protein N7510_007386 [Penicillium lagena]|uniref:uncharacterized protein n=1 Tax=Penicillium lagena TaxID=94218 RepID=UPI002540128C|nr:uncharacterized protein N7510_007386 [Penicillium lagena]KAJ5610667.1 hypothetical protein N7510_007386 [Penicillium lagena]